MEESRIKTSSNTFLTPKEQHQNPNVLDTQPKKKLSTPKTSRGRQKIEIKEIHQESKRQVTFSKRRRGLFKKAAELSVLTGAKIAVITFSKCGRIYKFGHVDNLVDKYLRKIPVNLEVYSGDDVAEEEEEGGKSWWERPAESVADEDLGEYVAAMSVLRDKLGKRIVEMSNIPAWMGFKPTVDMQCFDNLTVGQNM
ncbi:unnamed protein product [Cochlearia groenlandica]